MIATTRNLSFTLILGLSSAFLSEGAVAKGSRPQQTTAAVSGASSVVLETGKGVYGPDNLDKQIKETLKNDKKRLDAYTQLIESRKTQVQALEGSMNPSKCTQGKASRLFKTRKPGETESSAFKCLLNGANPGFVAKYLGLFVKYAGQESSRDGALAHCKNLFLLPQAVIGKKGRWGSGASKIDIQASFKKAAGFCFNNLDKWAN